MSSNILYSDFATPRIVAFKLWQSPPLVNIPILLMSAFPFFITVQYLHSYPYSKFPTTPISG